MWLWMHSIVFKGSGYHGLLFSCITFNLKLIFSNAVIQTVRTWLLLC